MRFKHWTDDRKGAEDEAGEANRLTLSLAGVVVALILVVAGLWLIQHLREKGQVEDCILQGRINCDQVLASSRLNAAGSVR